MSTEPIARMERGLKITARLWSIGAVITAVVLVLLINGRIDGRDRIHLEQVLFSTWTLGPPCWFILQSRFWPPPPDGFDRFRLHQGLVKAAWAGIAAFQAAIFFGRWG